MKGMGDSSMTGMDPSDATKQSELDKDRKMRQKMMKHDMKKGRDVSKVNYSSVEQRKRAQKKFGEKPKKKVPVSFQKGGKNHPDSYMAQQLAMGEASAAEVLKKRYASYHPDDNPQATRKLKPGEHSQPKGANVYKRHPGTKFQSSTGTYSKKGKMAALKKQHARRPEQYGITRESEEVVNELSRRTLTNYIQKAANPVGKKSAITYASKGAYKLGKSDKYDLDAGEKDDRKAFKRGKGIMRAAQKIQRKTYGNMTKPTPVNELKKSTLGSYIKKATGDAISKSHESQFNIQKGMSAQDKGQKKIAKKHFDKGKEASDKTMRRFHGINRAAGKLTPGKGKDEYLADKNKTKMGASQKTFKQMHSSKVKATEAVDQKDVKGLKKLAKGLKGSSQAHLDQMKKLNKMISDSYIAEKSLPNNPKLWAAKKAQAKAKFDVYPSAYANGWAAKQYKKAGGTWRSAK
jgi:hypothetical protein